MASPVKAALAALVGYVIAREVVDRRRTSTPAPSLLDARGIPTHACPACGWTFFRFVGHFEDYELAFYVLDGACDDCGALVTVPTPVDAPGYVA